MDQLEIQSDDSPVEAATDDPASSPQTVRSDARADTATQARVGAPMQAIPSYEEHMEAEKQRAKLRRAGLGLTGVRKDDSSQWGLALSGGGIRSATFCLGVLQALSRMPAAPLARPAPPSAGGVAPKHDGFVPPDCLLAQFDYLSTVSGGGYIGGFFASLFIRGRLDGVAAPAAAGAGAVNDSEVDLANRDAACVAYRLVSYDPPPRMREDLYDNPIAPERTAKLAMAWLRENGRYLSPTSAGDTLYNAATVVRAWFGMQYVLGSMLVCLLILLALGKLGYNWAWAQFGAPGAPDQPEGLLDTLWIFETGRAWWWSSMWDFLVLIVALWLVPCMMAFWLAYPRGGRSIGEQVRMRPAWWRSPRIFRRGARAAPTASEDVDWHSTAIMAMLMLALSVGTLILSIVLGSEWQDLRRLSAVCAGLMVLAVCWWSATFAAAGGVIGNHRVMLTRCLSRGLRWAGVMLFIAVVDTAAQWLYSVPGHRAQWLPQLTLGGALTWAVHLAQNLIKNSGGVVKPRLPMNLLFGALGLLLMGCLCGLWDMTVLWLEWGGDAPALSTHAIEGRFQLMSVSFAVALALVLIVAMFPQFLNLSTLSGLYGSRLTRAYLGASNGARYKPGVGSAVRSSAEPEAGDYVQYGEYTANPYAPMHLINICLNQNVDPAEQLVQRDRKGRPLVVLPNVSTASSDWPAVAVDGQLLMTDPTNQLRGEKLTIGEWIAVSGAAVSSGMGRGTSAAKAFLLGISNLRLGHWWQSGIKVDLSYELSWSVRQLRRTFPTQVYLIEELAARFHGLRRRFHFLSDGGHFDNTGIYELLRPQRNIKLILACDCGADPHYRFDDIGVLIRLARIDFGLDLRLDSSLPAALDSVFGDFHSVGAAGVPTSRCALLLNGFRDGSDPMGEPDVRIVVLKPVRLAAMPGDLCNHAVSESEFPQHTTADQFFDEAQWESYRKLGMLVAERAIGSGQAHAVSLWDVLSRTT